MIYTVFNGPMQTTAAAAKVGTGTAIKTLLQIKPTVPGKILQVEWGFDGFTAATPLQMELIETGTVFATVTAYAAADFTGIDAEAVLFGDPTSNYFSVGTSASGYTASAEGSITTVRNLIVPQLAPPTGPFIEQLPLGANQGFIQAGKCVRIRVTAPAGVNAYVGLTISV